MASSDNPRQASTAASKPASDIHFFTSVPTDYVERFKGLSVVTLPIYRGFTYPPLPAARHIRLLHLYPIKGKSKRLRGSLKVHELKSACDFEAISYAWGDWPELNNCIFLDDQVMKITDNLRAALYAYSDRNTRVLWVDAICINQADALEKAQQVAIMAEIYSKATMVQVWLAPHHEFYDKAMSFMAELAQRATSMGIADNVDQPRLLTSFPSVNISREEAEQLARDAIEAHVHFLLLRSWFNRVWIIQESALAKDMVLSCGITKMKWGAFAFALEALRGTYRLIPRGLDSDRLQGVKAAWELVRFRDAFRFFDKYTDRNHHFATEPAARLMSNKSCTDDRDRVYAMLSMIKSPFPMTPNYNLTVGEAYTEFTKHYSPNKQIHLAGLCRRRSPCEIRNEVALEENIEMALDIGDRNYLPSWVPELRPSRNLAWASPFSGLFLTLRKTPYFFFGHPDVRTMMCASGTIFDSVVRSTPDYRSFIPPYCALRPEFFFSVVHQLHSLLHPHSEFPTAESTAPHSWEGLDTASEPLWMILAKTLTGGVGECTGAGYLLLQYTGFKPLEYLGPGSLPWLTHIWNCFFKCCISTSGEIYQKTVLEALGVKQDELQSVNNDIARHFLVFVANILVPNRLFTTKHGYLGLAPRDIRVGDLIAVFNGCDMPYVVRPVQKVVCEENRIEGGVQVIGPCYLHGIMNGEIVTYRDAPRFSRFKWTRLDGDDVDSLEGRLNLI